MAPAFGRHSTVIELHRPSSIANGKTRTGKVGTLKSRKTGVLAKTVVRDVANRRSMNSLASVHPKAAPAGGWRGQYLVIESALGRRDQVRRPVAGLRLGVGVGSARPLGKSAVLVTNSSTPPARNRCGPPASAARKEPEASRFPALGELSNAEADLHDEE